MGETKFAVNLKQGIILTIGLFKSNLLGLLGLKSSRFHSGPVCVELPVPEYEISGVFENKYHFQEVYSLWDLILAPLHQIFPQFPFLKPNILDWIKHPVAHYYTIQLFLWVTFSLVLHLDLIVDNLHLIF